MTNDETRGPLSHVGASGEARMVDVGGKEATERRARAGGRIRMSAAARDAIRANTIALKAPITTPIGKGFRSVNVALRQELGLYACVRPCKTYKGVRS